MIITRARKMRIYPSDIQKHEIDTTLNCCRYIYNKMLERNSRAYTRRGEHLSYRDMQNILPAMKKYLPWLAGADSQALEYACRQLDTAYQRFFKKQAEYPRFHSKKGRQSYTTTNPNTISAQAGKVKLPKLGWVKTSDKRCWDDGCHICQATVSRETDGRYFVSIAYRTEIADPPTCGSKAIGLDYKSDGLYVDSEGNIAEMPHYYRKAQKERTKLSRQLSKKLGYRKGERKSNNFTKQQKRIARKERHIAGQRKDYLHKLSTGIANQYDVVCIETFFVQKNMLLDKREPVTKLRHNVNKAHLDNGWYMFTTMLDYKLSERGKHLIRVDKDFPSTQTCHNCGNRHPIKLTERIYRCPVCGAVSDRDINAALNIRDEGLRMMMAAA